MQNFGKGVIMLKAINKFINLSNKQHIALIMSIAFFMLPIQIQALPSGARVAAGLASFNKNGNHLNITTSNKAIINYNSFNIGRKEGVRFIQPSSSSVVLNRVVKANNPSSILGSLNANGRVFLVNPAGIYFGANSKVNANSFLATTLNITNDNFLKGNYQFNKMKNYADSYIVQKGSITVSPEGFVILASPLLSSQGSIMAKAGHITLGATDNFYVEFDPSGLVRYDYKQNKITNNDKPIALPKEYANSIINSVVNTDTINKVIKIVKHGNIISLEGASGSAFISSKLNTNAVNQNQAGKIEVKAQKNAFILNGANFQSNAKDNGNGGYISVFSHNLTYSDKGASYIANGGSVNGNGGFVEVSAKDKVVFDGSKVSLHAPNGEMGLFLIDPDNIIISNDSIYSGIDTSFTADQSITVNDGITVSTRDIGTSTDYLHAASQGDSGSLTMSAPSITVGSGSNLLTFADSGYKSGTLTLNAVSNTADVGVQALSSINLNGSYLRGGAISIKAEANSLDHFDSTNSANPVDPIEKALDFLSDVPTLPVGLSIAKSKATVDVKNGTTIDGDSIDITTNANSQASVLTIFTAVGVGYGESEATAQTSIGDSATLKSTHDINIQSNVVSDNKVKVYTVGLGAGRGSTANMSLAYAKSDTTSTVNIENGANVNAAGKLNVDATASKEIEASASAGSYDNGTVGTSVAITNSNSDTEANVGGTINAKSLSINAQTDNNLIKTASSSSVGSGVVSGRVVKATNNVISSVENYFNAHAQSSNSESGSSKPALSAAFSYADHTSNSVADIADNAVVNVDTTTDISAKNSYLIDTANGKKGVKSSATATIDSNDADQKTFSVAGAVAITKLSNTAKAYIGEGSVLNSKKDITLSSSTKMPYEITWNQVNSVSDIGNYANSNLGLQNGFFTTWAQSNSQGKVAGVAGSVNYFHMSNDTESYVDKNAKINQNQTQYGALTLEALTDLETMNLSGVFGWKVLGSSGKSGLGGSYLDIEYDDTTKAEINDGAYAKANTLSMSATSNTKNISVAEAGTNAEKYGAAGSFSYLKINNTTQTNVNNANIIVTGASATDDFALKSDDTAKLFNVSGGIIKSGNVGIGASVSINEITRNTLASIENSQITTKGQNYIYAQNSGVIDAYSLAAAVTAPGAPSPDVSSSAPNGAGKFGIGVSGDVSINTISDNADAHIKNSTLTNQNSDLNLKAKNSSEIKSFTGSAAITTSSKSIGLAGSYSQNSITNLAQSYIDSSTITADKVSLSASNDNDIQGVSASGSGAPLSSSGSIAGSVSINSVAAVTKAYIQNSSDITANSDVTLSSDDTSSIKALAGAVSVGGKAGIGASFAKNDITDTISSYLSSSDLSSKGDLKITSDFSGTIKLLAVSVGASLSGMAAGISVSLNNIANDITSYIDGKKTSAGIHADGNTQVSSDDTSNINIISGGVSGASAVSIGASILYNVIKNTLLSYLNNTNISTDGNMIVRAKSDKAIQAVSVGGAGAGDASLAGSVVINTIKNHTSSYISGTQANVKGTLSLKAIDDSTISNYGGTGSGAGTVGIGGTVIVNNIQNSILAYIDNNSIINALGNDFLSVLSGDEKGDKEDVRGLDIFASGRSDIKNFEGTIGIGGSGALAATVSTNIIKNIIWAYIDNSEINQASNANSLQDARVRSFAYTNLYNIIGAAALSGDAGIGASVDTSIIENSTKSYITGNSNIKANNLIQVKSDGLERLNSVAASGAGSTVAFAGSVETIVLDNTNEAYVQNSVLSSDKDLDILSNDSSIYGTKKDGTKSGIIVGGIQGSVAASLGGAVFVNSAKHTVKAYVDNSTLNAKGSTDIKTNSSFDVLLYIANIGGSGGVSLSASVVVNNLTTLSQAYTIGSTNINQDDSFKTSSQNVDITGKSSTAVDTTVGSIAVASLAGIGGSVDITNIKDTVLAQIGAGNKVNAGGNLLVNADSSKTVQDKVGAFSGGAAGVAGAVSITNINKALNGDQVNSYDNTKSQSNTIVSKDNVKGRIGDASQANEADSDIQSNTPANIDDAFSTAQPNSSTIARIDDGSIVNSGLDTTVQATDTVKYQSLTGSLGAGIVGAGGSVGIGEIGSNTQALIGNGVELDIRNLYVTSEFNVNDTNIQSYAAAAGLVGLGAAVSELNINDYTTLAFIGTNSLINSSGSIYIQSKTSPTAYTKALGAAAGALAIGVVMSKTNINGTTGTYIGTNSHLSANGDIALNSVFDTPSTISSLSQAAAGGIYSGAGSVSTTDVSPYIFTTLQDYAALYALGNIDLASIGNGSLSSNAEGISIGELTVGVSDAKSYWTPVINTNIQNNVQLNSNNLFANAFENTDTSGNFQEGNEIKSSSFSAAGALYGGSGSSSYAKNDATVKVNIGNSNIITTNQDSNFQAKSFSKTVTNSSGNNYGVLAAGSTHATSENYSDTAIDTGTQNKIESTNSDINMYSYSKINASSSTTGGAGGLISGAGTLSKVDITNNSNINIGQNNKLYAKKGDINLNAEGYIDSSADTSITTAGGITINESESNININQNIGVTVNDLSQLEAENININAKSLYLHAVLSSLSHTIAADSTSKAYSILHVNSNAKVDIKPQAKLTGYNSVNINALQNNVYFDTYAKAEIKAGLTGTTYAKVENYPTINSNVNVENGSEIYTRNLNIKSSAPDKSENIYKLNAKAVSNTVVQWVLTTVDKLVKKVSKIPIIGWFVKWVWHKVKEWVKHILNSDASSDMLGEYVSNGDIALNGNVYQLSSSPQSLTIAPDGMISSQGSISANVGANNIVVNDLINHDIGKITLDASGQLNGNANIYLSNSYPSVDITNQTDKNLLINKITMISDNANQPNLEISTNDGGDLSNFNIQPVVLPHTINIQNSGNGNIVFNKLVDNYGGSTTVTNSYGSILANNGALIKSKNVNFVSQRGSVGLLGAPLEVELTKSSNENPTVNINSFQNIYFALKLSELLNSQPTSNYTIDKALLNNIQANGKIGITLHTPTYSYYDTTADDFVNLNTQALYAINNIYSNDDIAINGEAGNSISFDGTMQSGQKDLGISINDSDPSITSSEYISSITPTDIYLNPIAVRGGHININLDRGLFYGSGTATVLNGYMHLNIQNNTPKNLNTDSIKMGKRTDGSFIVNGVSKSFNTVGYNSGLINIASNNGGQIQLGEDIVNQSGSTNIVGNNGIYNMAQNLINSKDMMLDSSAGGDVGTVENPIYISGTVSAKSASKVYLYGPTKLTLDSINAKNAYLSSNGVIKGVDATTPNITANYVALDAQEDINSIANSFLTLKADTIAVNSVNGAIKLNNSKNSVIGTVGDITGLHGANNVAFTSQGTLHQVKGADIVSDSSGVTLSSAGNMDIDFVKAPNRITLTSQNGAISQDGDSADDIVSNELLIQAKNGIGDDGVSEKYLDTKVNVIDAKNNSVNDIAIKNSQSLSANDLNGNGYALYNGGGDIKLIVNGAFTQQSKTTIETPNDLSIDAKNNIFVSYLKANNIFLNSREGSILGDTAVSTNIKAGNNLIMYALNGKVGTPANPLHIIKPKGGTIIKAKKSKNLISVYVFSDALPTNFHVDQDLAIFNNRPISGSLIDIYNSILSGIFHNPIHNNTGTFMGFNNLSSSLQNENVNIVFKKGK